MQRSESPAGGGKGSKMKSLSRFLGRSKSGSSDQGSSTPPPPSSFHNAPVDSPEANVQASIRRFCESGSMSNGGEEVLHLPVIVEAAESSPVAAAAAAHQIRSFLTKEWSSKAYVQYNAIMLIRILSDNPGPNFTRNFDKQFVSTIKELLRNCKDGSTQQILRETLDTMEANQSLANEEGVQRMIAMWRKEKGWDGRLSYGGQRGQYGFPQNGNVYGQQSARPQQQRTPSHQRQLPPPQELASRIEEARNTAKILLQLIQSSPQEEVLNNDLLREFAERCQTAQRSMQGYINCDSPPPDDDTMLTLIETNEQLSLASSRYQRALLSARKAAGLSPSPQPQNGNGTSPSNGPYAVPPLPSSQPINLFDHVSPPQNDPQSAFQPAPNGRDESFEAPPGPPPGMLARLNSRDGQQSPPQPPPKQHDVSPPQQASDPFADPVEHNSTSAPMVSINQSSDSHPERRPHSQTFSVDAGTTYPSSLTPGQPASPQRPAIGAWHNSEITPSFIGRQDEAAQGFTMHGAQPETPGVSEIDGHSEVGRTERDADDMYDVSPVTARHRGLGGR